MVHQQGATVDREPAHRDVWSAAGGCQADKYVLLDTTRLDVFAMDAFTLRWVKVELTVGIDPHSRCDRAAVDADVDEVDRRDFGGVRAFQPAAVPAPGGFVAVSRCSVRVGGAGGQARRAGRGASAGDSRGRSREDLCI